MDGHAPTATFRVRVDPALAEAVVYRVLLRAEAFGIAPEWVAAHRRRLDRLYDVEPTSRDATFGRFATSEFEALDLIAPLREAISERPAFADRVAVVLVGEAGGRFDEGVTCESAGRHLGIRLETRRFDDRDDLLAWARHALGHAEDTLDPAFGFEPRWDEALRRRGGGASVGRLHRLWDVGVDARIAAAGRLDVASTLQRHRSALAADLPDVAAATIDRVVGYLWAEPRPTFGRLRSWAERPTELLDEAAPGDAAQARPDRCPLCGFPSADVDVPDGLVAAAVSADYPAWRPADGVCGRCSDRYLIAGALGGRA